MKKFLEKYAALFLALLLISAVCFLFAGRKEGMFIDEIYTYGLANGYYTPFVTDIKGGDVIDQVISRQELFDYMTVGEDDGFAFASVYYNQTQDVHPPLYYWLLNMASSLTPGVFSKWTGIVLDYIIYMLTLVVLFALTKELTASRTAGVVTVLLYGLSTVGLSTMLMIRMYVLLTLLTVFLAYCVAKLLHGGAWIWRILAGLSIFAGLLTQYYFVFYAFFLCAFYVFYLLFKKDFKGILYFALCAFAGVAAFILAFPACFDQLFADALVSGGNALENAKTLSQYPERIGIFLADTRHRTKGIVIAAAVMLVLCVLHLKAFSEALTEKRLPLEGLIILLPALITFFLVAIISPVTEIRYVYNIMPFFGLAAGLILGWVYASDGENIQPKAKMYMLLFIAALALFEARAVAPDYLYDEYSDYDAMLAPYASTPCVYFNDNYRAPLTYDLLQLMIFDDFIVVNDADSPALSEYMGGSGEAVVFIDNSAYWSSGYVNEDILAGLEDGPGYRADRLLYSNGFSSVYLVVED